MNILKRKSITPVVALAFALIFLVFVAVFTISSKTHAQDSSGLQSSHLITIHDRGNTKVVLTKAMTIGNAIADAGIPIDKKDMVEPDVNQKLIASNYQVNIYRARPVLVIDGNIRQKIITPYQTPLQIAAGASIVVYPEDITTIDRVDNLVSGAGLQMTIKRATPFEFTLYGKTSTVRTQAKTVGGMLSEKGIKLSKDDRVLPSVNTKIVAGLPVRVWREGKQTITAEEPINFDIEKIQDADRPVGYLNITIHGVTGTRNVTYETVVQDGKEVSRKEIASLTTKLPVKQVEIVGAKAPVGNVSGQKKELMALAGISSSDFGYVDYIVGRESGWNASSVGMGGACGLPQASPCSKLGSNWNDPVYALQWANSYAVGKYGSWSAAYSHWLSSNNW